MCVCGVCVCVCVCVWCVCVNCFDVEFFSCFHVHTPYLVSYHSFPYSVPPFSPSLHPPPISPSSLPPSLSLPLPPSLPQMGIHGPRFPHTSLCPQATGSHVTHKLRISSETNEPNPRPRGRGGPPNHGDPIKISPAHQHPSSPPSIAT